MGAPNCRRSSQIKKNGSPETKRSWQFIIGVIAFILISCGIIAICEANAAESAIVSFDDAEHLGAQIGDLR